MNRRSLSVLALSVWSIGCASLEEALVNIPACAIGEQKAYVLSMYGPIGIGSKLSPASGKVICPAAPSKTPVNGETK